MLFKSASQTIGSVSEYLLHRNIYFFNNIWFRKCSRMSNK